MMLLEPQLLVIHLLRVECRWAHNKIPSTCRQAKLMITLPRNKPWSRELKLSNKIERDCCTKNRLKNRKKKTKESRRLKNSSRSGRPKENRKSREGENLTNRRSMSTRHSSREPRMELLKTHGNASLIIARWTQATTLEAKMLAEWEKPW